MSDIILPDHYEEPLRALLRLKPFFALETGIFSQIQREFLRCAKTGALAEFTAERKAEGTAEINLQVFGAQPNSYYHDFFQDGYTPSYTHSSLKNFFEDKSWNSESFAWLRAHTISQPPAQAPARAGELIDNIGNQITEDCALLSKDDLVNGSVLAGNSQCEFRGNLNDFYAGTGVELSKLAAIDTREGPVVLGDNVKISPFSLIKGPVFIGANSIIDRAAIENSRAGTSCRLGGEISNCIIGNYTNKHHEGFIGHSIIGDWVNLGALTTTSDLKNNYGQIKLQFEKHNYNTNRIKFGSIIGDFVKTAIGTMLNTGTILDIGCLIFEGRPVQKYYPPFYWGGVQKSDDYQRYDLQRFLNDAHKIMARRGQVPGAFQQKQISLLYNS